MSDWRPVHTVVTNHVLPAQSLKAHKDTSEKIQKKN